MKNLGVKIQLDKSSSKRPQNYPKKRFQIQIHQVQSIISQWNLRIRNDPRKVFLQLHR